MDTFTAGRFDRHPTELAALFGTRFVTAQETEEGRIWDAAKVKSITAGDSISARFMYKDFFSFRPQFKLLLSGNHKPHLRSLGEAERRRFHLVPFTRRPKIKDPELPEALVAEYPAILHWAIQGCLAWQQIGLQPPAAVLAATEEYFEEEDTLGRWLRDRTQRGGQGTELVQLWIDWQDWCKDRGEKAGTERSFSANLIAHGFEKGLHPKTRRVVIKDVQTTRTPIEDFED
jgi:putative DNA primase/helicase